MPFTVGDLQARLTADTTDFVGGLLKAQGALIAFTTGVAEAGASLSVGLSAPLAAVTGFAFKAAADVQRNQAAFAATFGAMASSAEDFAKRTATALGLNVDDLQKQMTGFQRVTSAMGLAPKAATEASELLTRAAQQIGARFGDVDHATEALTMGVAGATRGLRTIGIYIDQVAVKQEAIRMGFIKANEQMTLQARQAATLSLILQQVNRQYGDQLPTMDNAIGRMRQFKAAAAEFEEELGAALMPAATKVLEVLTRLWGVAKDGVTLWAALPSPIKVTTEILGALAIAIGPVMLGVAKLTTAVQTLWAAMASTALSAWVAVMANLRTVTTAWQISLAMARTEATGLNAVLIALRATLTGILPLLGPIALTAGFAVLGILLKEDLDILRQAREEAEGLDKDATIGAYNTVRQLEAFRHARAEGRNPHNISELINSDWAAGTAKALERFPSMVQNATASLQHLQGAMRNTGLAAGDLEKVQAALASLDDGLESAQQGARVLGANFNLAQQQAAAYKTAIDALIKYHVGLNTVITDTDHTLARLIARWQATQGAADDRTMQLALNAAAINARFLGATFDEDAARVTALKARYDAFIATMGDLTHMTASQRMEAQALADAWRRAQAAQIGGAAQRGQQGVDRQQQLFGNTFDAAAARVALLRKALDDARAAGLSDDAELKGLNMTVAQTAVAYGEAADALEVQQHNLKIHEQMVSEAARITEEGRTRQEQYNDAIAHLDTLKPMLSLQAYQAAVKRVNLELGRMLDIGREISRALAGGIVEAFAKMGEAIAKGGNAFKAFGDAALGAIGNMMKTVGEMLIAYGIQVQLAITNPLAAIAAGAALVALGSAISATAQAAVAGGGGGGTGGAYYGGPAANAVPQGDVTIVLPSTPVDFSDPNAMDALVRAMEAAQGRNIKVQRRYGG